jgi:histidine ammonia-lyase
MNKLLFLLFLFTTFLSFGWSDQFNNSEPLILNGEQLTIDDVARFRKTIKISAEAQYRVVRSHQLLISGAKFNLPIYGLNRGVGLNKDRKIFKGDAIDPEIKEISEQFNKNMIYSHSTGVGSDMPQEVIRAAMVVRLNTLLRGVSGIHLRQWIY